MTGDDDGGRNTAISAMLDAMGDHEYYCATYSSKDQPHVEGLLQTLSDSLRAKEQDIVRAKTAGEEFPVHESARRVIHNLVAATNRRMHKGFQEMLTFLLEKPLTYSSHTFVQLNFNSFLRIEKIIFVLYI